MTTKEKFLSDIKAVTDKYSLYARGGYDNGIPDQIGTSSTGKPTYGYSNSMPNNLTNYSILGVTIKIPDENTFVHISSKELWDYICNK